MSMQVSFIDLELSSPLCKSIKSVISFTEFNQLYGPIALEVTTSGFPIVHLYDRKDIEKVLRYPSKFPFRPPTEIVSMYRMSRPDRYASVGIANEQVHLLFLYVGFRWVRSYSTKIRLF